MIKISVKIINRIQQKKTNYRLEKFTALMQIFIPKQCLKILSTPGYVSVGPVWPDREIVSKICPLIFPFHESRHFLRNNLLLKRH